MKLVFTSAQFDVYAHERQQYEWLENIFQEGAVIFQLILQHFQDITSIIMLYKDGWAPQNARNNLLPSSIYRRGRAILREKHLDKFVY